jgi:hypothetical protein
MAHHSADGQEHGKGYDIHLRRSIHSIVLRRVLASASEASRLRVVVDRQRKYYLPSFCLAMSLAVMAG